jgi:hypothetical protein
MPQSLIGQASAHAFFSMVPGRLAVQDGHERLTEAWPGRRRPKHEVSTMRLESRSVGCRLVMAAVALGLLFGADAALAQSPPLKIPFVDEWAGSPHARLGAEAFNHWNAEGEVPVPCARCHSTPGFLDYIGADGTPPGLDGPAPVGTVISCVACHNDVTIRMDSVTFPSGAVVDKVGDDARCMTCHQGRESTVSVDAQLAGAEPDTVSAELRFINVHYRAAGATRYGTEAKGAYEYPGLTYVGYFLHDPDSRRCADCHQQHTVRVMVQACATCHQAPQLTTLADLVKIRKNSALDFDGDGNVEEGIAEEITTLHAALYQAIQSYALAIGGQAIVYSAGTYPYFFNDSNANGKVDPGEAVFPNAFKSWTPRLLRAAYNYQYVVEDPGAYTHNPLYVIRVLHDSLQDLGSKVEVDMAGMARPEAE